MSAQIEVPKDTVLHVHGRAEVSVVFEGLGVHRNLLGVSGLMADAAGDWA